MISTVEIKAGNTLADYEKFANLMLPVKELHQEAEQLIPPLKGRKVWMVNSTAQGGGVAEMLPRMLSIMQQIGVDTEWVVINTQEAEFFRFTKKLHNLIHGEGEASINESERQIFEQVNQINAESFLPKIGKNDVVVIHDPQPIAMIKYLKPKLPEVKFIWRCHIGLDYSNEQTEAVWAFLRPYLEQYDQAIFTAPEYIPSFVRPRVSIIHPSLDPLSHKNRKLHLDKFAGILYSANLIPQRHTVVEPPFDHRVQRLQPDGQAGSPHSPDALELLFTPTIVQVSRWDRLKGFLGLMQAFVKVKQNIANYRQSERHERVLNVSRLVLAGPDPAFIQDDPEGQEVFKELTEYYQSLPEDIQGSIAILQMPMQSAKDNALIINALQRCATIIVQNSHQEGFGLTVTEAMWKEIPVLSTHACGVRQQIRDQIDGKLINNPEDPNEIAQALSEMLANPKTCKVYAQNAKKRVFMEFLVFTQIRKYLRLINRVIKN